MAHAARQRRHADRRIAIRRLARRSANVGQRRGGDRHHTRAPDRIRVALWQPARIFAHSVRRRARWSVSPRLRAAAPRKGNSARRAFCGRRAFARREPVHARPSHRVSHGRNRTRSRSSAGVCAVRLAGTGRRGAVSHAALSAARARRAAGMVAGLRLHRHDRHSARRRVAGDRRARVPADGARAALVAVRRADLRRNFFSLAVERARCGDKLVDGVERFGRRYERRLPRFHRRRPALFRLRRGLLLRARPPRSMGRRTSRVPCSRHQHDRSLRHLELASAHASAAARFHRRHRSTPGSSRRAASCAANLDSR